MFEERFAEWLDQGKVLVESESNDAVDAVALWERFISWAQAQQLVATNAVAGEASAWVTTVRGRAELSDVQVAGAELAPALRVARVTAQHRVRFAMQVTDRLPDSLAALAAGVITMPKLRAIEEATAVLSAELAHRVETMILPVAADKTPGELRAALARAAIRVDPTAAEKRRKTAVGDRKVTTVPLPDGMAGLWGVMAAEKTVAAYTIIDTFARLAKTPDDDRGIDARRADALYDLIADAHDQLTGNDPNRITISLTDDAGTATPETGSGGGAAAGPAGTGSETDGGRVPGTGRQPRRSARLYSVQVAVPAETLTGESDEPGHLGGYGPITSLAARELAADDATWQRILYDAITGTVLDVGRNRYRPPVGLASTVLARDRTCRHPGCRQPAHRCDLDHCRRFPEGPTAYPNLVTLCRFHHRLKHHTKWTSAIDSAGVVTWTSPTGRVYVTQPWEYRAGPLPTKPPDEHMTDTDLNVTAGVDFTADVEPESIAPT